MTYTIIVSTRNEDDTLLPGMTANVEIIIGERSDALQVPSAALRFTPSGTQAARSTGQGGAQNTGRGSDQTQRGDHGERKNQTSDHVVSRGFHSDGTARCASGVTNALEPAGAL